MGEKGCHWVSPDPRQSDQHRWLQGEDGKTFDTRTVCSTSSARLVAFQVSTDSARGSDIMARYCNSRPGVNLGNPGRHFSTAEYIA